MEFIETPIFTKWVESTITDDSYLKLQVQLMFQPELGKLIQNGSGIRKIRWNLGNKGKRGGVRIIYYYKVVSSQIFMLFAYSKKEQGDLTMKQKKVLGEYAKEL